MMKRKAAAKPKSRSARRVKAPRKAAKTAKTAPTRRGGRTPQPDAIGPLIAASELMLGLRLDPAWQDGIRFNLKLLFDHAARVDDFALPDDAEPAPVFNA